ncbi:MAG: rhodanese-like domain-containing protein [Ignavibacteriales bacterium]|nr:rhodanese-like domain-containing protein [Ignavibacteriales bacterium]
MNKTNFKVILAILMSSTFLGFIYNFFSSDGIDFIRKPILVKSVSIGEENGDSNQLRGIDLSQAVEIFNDNSATFIDARDQWEYSDNHIIGAINIPEFSFDPSNKYLVKLNKEELLIVYCDGDDCDLSKRLAQKLISLGFKNTYVFLDGFNSWLTAELPIEKGKLNE